MVGTQVSTSLAGAEELASSPRTRQAPSVFFLGFNKLLEKCLNNCPTHPAFVAFHMFWPRTCLPWTVRCLSKRRCRVSDVVKKNDARWRHGPSLLPEPLNCHDHIGVCIASMQWVNTSLCLLVNVSIVHCVYSFDAKRQHLWKPLHIGLTCSPLVLCSLSPLISTSFCV